MTVTSGIVVSKEKLMDEAHSTDYSLVLDNDGWTCFLLRARKRAMQNSIFLQPLFQASLFKKWCIPLFIDEIFESVIGTRLFVMLFAIGINRHNGVKGEANG
ncbi:uncharacterized protein LOC105782597 isoform X3 [Gossypium raimondii]|uniref:uncharacterized protein LOC105782597 isoform X3 n=1 Tax=Gossypium raimondii TaxID=29730 RepID=UPI00227C8476|nr:uncharacterized protein LOC105782597 isoform X3 [Gossypium raimondii]XP_052482474.1 uncharacterized protein LOC105782597 isoform X3 [Gossypium raimondii]XP_052482475.1 uncharacterized protein LOC105782597 isoform X4 [Gossypium raimondii]XP_052482476.1 uncharacterized protein LOC105782597 isoform X5 [Gossypium raimondii]XP_052482477.1 uncharacterized protein LOC105782597 isoform X3 [Gossypium raimondii]XP_052482478.1 uncharacterized protein LOC105782597 isoform X3 [Gossypium raimondii]